MNTNVNTNVDFGTNNSNTNTSNNIGSTPNNNQSTYQNTSPSNNNVQTENMDLSFATEQIANESKSILDSIWDFFSDLGEGLKETGATIANGAKTVANWAINGLKDLGSNIKEACTNLASNVSSILGSALTWAADTYIDLQSTAAVIGTTVVSGIANIGEGIVDGLAWTGGKLVEGGSWLVGKVAGWFSDDAEEAVMDWRAQAKTDVKEFIVHDWVGEANDWFYQETSLGQFLDENSYLKYDSEAMQKLKSATEMVGKLAIATAATFIPGGAVIAPLLLGFASGTGEQAEKLYQENTNTTGAQELGIFVSGLGESLNWYAQGKLGRGALETISKLQKIGMKATGAQLKTSFTSGLENFIGKIQTEGLGKTAKDALSALGKFIKGSAQNSHLASLQATDNLIDSFGIIADNTSDWLVGNEEFNLKTAAKAGGELISAWFLNMFFDGAGDYLGNLGKNADDIGTAVKQADEIKLTDSKLLKGTTEETMYGLPIKSKYGDYYLSSSINAAGQVGGSMKHVIQEIEKSTKEMYDVQKLKSLLDILEKQSPSAEVSNMIKNIKATIGEGTDYISQSSIKKSWAKIKKYLDNSSDTALKEMAENITATFADNTQIRKIIEASGIKLDEESTKLLLSLSEDIPITSAQKEQIEQIVASATEKLYCNGIDAYSQKRIVMVDSQGNITEALMDKDLMGVPVYVNASIDPNNPYYIEILTREASEYEQGIGITEEVIKHMNPEYDIKKLIAQGSPMLAAQKQGEKMSKKILTDNIKSIVDANSEKTVEEITIAIEKSLTESMDEMFRQPNGSQYIRNDDYQREAMKGISTLLSNENAIKYIQEYIEAVKNGNTKKLNSIIEKIRKISF